MSERRQPTSFEIEVPVAASLTMELDTERRILTLDHGLARLGGFLHDELGGADLDILIHPDTPRAVVDDMWRALQKGRPWSGVMKHCARGGGYFWLAVDVVPVRSRGRICCYKWVGSRALRQRVDQVEEVYRALAEFRDTPAVVLNGQVVANHVFARMARWILDIRLRYKLMFGSLIGVPLAAAYLGWADVPADALKVAGFSLLISGATGTFAVFLMERRLSLRIRDAGSVIETMARGDFHSRIDCNRDDEIGRLNQRLKVLQVRLGFDDPDSRDFAGPEEGRAMSPERSPQENAVAKGASSDVSVASRSGTAPAGISADPDRETLSTALRHLERIAFRSKILSLNLTLREEDGEVESAIVRDACECARMAADGVSILRARLGMDVASAPPDRRQPAGRDWAGGERAGKSQPIHTDHPEYDALKGEPSHATRRAFRPVARNGSHPVRRPTRLSRTPVPKIGRAIESQGLLEDDWEDFGK